MAKLVFSDQETACYAGLFLLAHRQLAAIQRQMGPGMSFWQRLGFRTRHLRIRRQLNALLQLKGGDREEAEKSVDEDLEFIGRGKKGWSYVSSGEIDYLQSVIKGI